MTNISILGRSNLSTIHQIELRETFQKIYTLYGLSFIDFELCGAKYRNNVVYRMSKGAFLIDGYSLFTGYNVVCSMNYSEVHFL
jgi:hypothetical protein